MLIWKLLQHLGPKIKRKLLLLILSPSVINSAQFIINENNINDIKHKLGSCGMNVWIQWPVIVSSPQMVHIGNSVSIAAYVHIWGGGCVHIGDRVMIGTHTSISSLTHDYNQEKMYDTLICKPVVIDSDVWIGSNCVILPGVHINRGAVIGAGAVVIRNVQENAIMVGVPARVLKQRELTFPDKQPELFVIISIMDSNIPSEN